jgi:hypothetical protein
VPYDKEYHKQYRLKNKKRIAKRKKLYYTKNIKHILEYQKEYRATHKDKIKKDMRRWASDNKEYRKEKAHENYLLTKDRRNERSKTWHKNKLRTDPNFKILCNLRTRIYSAVKDFSKSAHTMELMGCSISFLKKHLEKQFQPGMTWENYGKWHIDHRTPCADFDLIKPGEQKVCFNWFNLQPMWAIDNLRKNRYT